MKKREQQSLSPEVLVKKDWFAEVLKHQMRPYAGVDAEEGEPYESARRVLNHVYELSQVAQMWSQSGEYAQIDWTQVASIVRELASVLKQEQRRLSSSEEALLTALSGAFGMATSTSGLGDVLNGFSFGREPVIQATIAKLEQNSPLPEYQQAVDAFGSILRPPASV